MRLLVIVALLLGLSANAANWYVRTTSQGNAGGTAWTNAWSIANLNSGMSGLSAGDTVWFAGGAYTTGINFTKAGTSGNPIKFWGVLATDSTPTSAAGWNSSFACDVTQIEIDSGSDSPLDFQVDFIEVDGRFSNSRTLTIAQKRAGLLATGWRVSYNNAADAFIGAAEFTTAGVNDVTVKNLELHGPGTGTYATPAAFNYQGDNAAINFRPGSGSISNILFFDCIIHSSPNLIRNVLPGVRFITFDGVTFYDNWSSNGDVHENLSYNENGIEWTFRYSDFTGWAVEGIILWDVGNNTGPTRVHGCIFHGQATVNATCFWPGSETDVPQGPLFLYNNTFLGVIITSGQSRSWEFSSQSVSRNNIFWDSPFDSGSDFSLATQSHNFSDGTVSGTGSISSAPDPFVNLAGFDWRIVTTIAANKPRNKGTTITDANGQLYSVDREGNTRGSDGSWDMGALEFEAETVPQITSATTIDATNGAAFSYTIVTDVGATGYGASVPSPVVYLKLNEASGARLSAIGTNHFTDNNTVTSAAGLIDNAAAFTAANSEYLSSADHADLDFTTAFTLSTWIYGDNLTANAAIAAKWNYSSDGCWSLQLRSPMNGLRVFIANSATDSGLNFADFTVTLLDDTWHHVAFVYNGGLAAADRAAVYVDGVAQTAIVTGTIQGSLQASSAELRIGDFQGLNRFWQGRKDEFALFARAFTADQVVALYRSTTNGLPQGLVINHSTGVISGTPTVEGVFEVTLLATNTAGFAMTNVTFTIDPAQGGGEGAGIAYRNKGRASRSAGVIP